MVPMVNYSKYLRGNSTHFYKLFKNIKEKRTLSNSFHEVRITLIRIPDKDITRKKTTNKYIYECRCKNPKLNIRKPNPTACRRDYTL